MPVENRAKEVQLAVAVAQHAVLPDDVSKSTSTMNEGLATAKDSKGRRQQGVEGKQGNRKAKPPTSTALAHNTVTKQHGLSKRQTQKPWQAKKEAQAKEERRVCQLFSAFCWTVTRAAIVHRPRSGGAAVK